MYFGINPIWTPYTAQGINYESIRGIQTAALKKMLCSKFIYQHNWSKRPSSQNDTKLKINKKSIITKFSNNIFEIFSKYNKYHSTFK